MKESDLYLPLKKFLENHGYEVKGEIKDCDVMAIKEESEPIVIELKLSINLSVILQAVDRLSLTSQVYICLPKKYKLLKGRKRKVIKLLKMLGIGMIVVDADHAAGCIDVVVSPQPYKPRKSIKKLQNHLQEFNNRTGDPNLGGSSTQNKRVTAYRQRAVVIASYLKENGETKASVVAKHTKITNARSILYNNYYGWFEKAARGVYKITCNGMNEIPEWFNNNTDL